MVKQVTCLAVFGPGLFLVFREIPQQDQVKQKRIDPLSLSGYLMRDKDQCDDRPDHSYQSNHHDIIISLCHPDNYL